MSLLATATRGRVSQPPLLIAYGPDGVGKSEFASQAPAPFFIGAENGTNNLDVTRLAVTSWPDALKTMDELATTEHTHKTIVVDSLDWMEDLIVKYVETKEGKEIEKIGGGYGKGWIQVYDEWLNFITKVNACRAKGLGFIGIVHAKIKKFEDPSTPQGYERYQLKMHSGQNTDNAALWREFVDTVLFCNYVTLTSAEDAKRGFGDGERVFYTERRPGWDAKNRHGLPFVIPYKRGEGWEAFAEAMKAGDPASSDVLVSQINGCMERVKNKALLPKMKERLTEAGSDTAKLVALKVKIEAVIGKEA